MNQLTAKYASQGLQILGFPCNQFGLQENMGNGDILNILKYVRPGSGYVPNFPLFQKVSVNGATADPIFQWLKKALPLPSDDPYGNTIPVQAMMFWAPASRTDIDWNFSKFLVGRDGKPLKRWSEGVATADPGLVADIEKALNNKTDEIELLPVYESYRDRMARKGFASFDTTKGL
jgi:glutathione peroxidase